MSGPATDERLARLEARIAALEAENRRLERVGDAQETQNAPSRLHYNGYSPHAPARFIPVPPVPYRTLSETFSY